MAILLRLLRAFFICYVMFAGLVVVVNLISPNSRFEWLGFEGFVIGSAAFLSIVAGCLVWSGAIPLKGPAPDKASENSAANPKESRIKNIAVAIVVIPAYLLLLYVLNDFLNWLIGPSPGDWKDFQAAIFFPALLLPIYISCQIFCGIKDCLANLVAKRRAARVPPLSNPAPPG